MDVHVLDIINRANNNIKELIQELIELKKDSDRNYCCYGSLENRPECKGSCYECKKEFYDNMYKRLLRENVIRL